MGLIFIQEFLDETKEYMPYSITIGDRDKVLKTSTFYFLGI